MIDRPKPIDVTLVPEDQRLSLPAKLFGGHFLTIEAAVYAFADRLSRDYEGAYWEFYTLSNGGFYMAPSCEHTLYVECENFFQGELMPNAFGITCCLYTFSHLSFSENQVLSELATKYFHLIRDAVLDHPEGSLILGAID